MLRWMLSGILFLSAVPVQAALGDEIMSARFAALQSASHLAGLLLWCGAARARRLGAGLIEARASVVCELPAPRRLPSPFGGKGPSVSPGTN